jgi:hypothetical protein
MVVIKFNKSGFNQTTVVFKSEAIVISAEPTEDFVDVDGRYDFINFQWLGTNVDWVRSHLDWWS